MAWGAKGGRGVGDLTDRLVRNDPSLASLHIFPSRRFGPEEVQQICAALKSNTVLKELYASGHSMTPETAGLLGAMLASNTALVSLCVGNEALGDAGVKQLVSCLKQNSTLQKLDLENKGISADGAQSIADALNLHPSITELILAHNILADQGMSFLEPALYCLKVLDLRHCGFGPQGASHIANVLKHADCKLEVLHLAGNKISGNSLLRGLLGNESLRELHLAHTDIGDEGLDRICTALPVAKNLSYLDVSSCNLRLLSGLTLVVADAFHGIQDKAMLQEEFHGAIPDCAAHLQVLKLRDNGLDNEELQGLGEALQENSLLQDLDLAGNQVSVQTLQSLAPATVLQKLCLFNCKLDQEAAEQLVACLEDGGFSNLQELDLAGNNIEAPQMQALLQTLQHRDRAPSLKVLVLGGNPAADSDAFKEHVAKARAARPDLDIAWQASDPGQSSS